MRKTALLWLSILWHHFGIVGFGNTLADTTFGDQYFDLMTLFSNQNIYDSAIWYGNHAIDHYAKFNDSSKLMDTYHELSLIHQDMGVYEEAIRHNQHALKIAVATHTVHMETHLLADRALFYSEYGIKEKSIGYGIQAQNRLKEINDSVSFKEIAHVSNALAKIMLLQHQYDSAISQFQLTVQETSKTSKLTKQDSVLLARTYNSISKAHFKKGDADAAIRVVELAIDILKKVNSPYDLSESLAIKANLLIKASIVNKRLSQKYFGTAFCF